MEVDFLKQFTHYDLTGWGIGYESVKKSSVYEGDT